MKKLVLAALAATIGMSAVAAEAGTLRFNNHAWVRADIDVPATTKKNPNGRSGGDGTVSVRLNWYATAFNVKDANGNLVPGAQETVTICPTAPAYGCSTFSVPEGDAVRRVNLHGTLGHLWYEDSTARPDSLGRQNGYGSNHIDQYWNY